MSERHHRFSRNLLPVATLLALLSPNVALAQGGADTTQVTIVGSAVDAATRRPLQNVVLRFPVLDLTRVSDEEGDFGPIRIRPGVYLLSLSRHGYKMAEGDFAVRQAGSFVFELNPLSVSPSAEPSQVMGLVTDGETEEPLANVWVTITNTDLVRMTNSEGRFEFPLVPPGLHLLRVEHLGYALREDSVFIPPGRTIDLRIRAGVEPIPLEGITVEVEARDRFLDAGGFYRRRDWGLGKQWTKEDMEKENTLFLTDLVRTIPGLQLERQMYGWKIYSKRRTGIPDDPADPMPVRCELAVYVDGFRMRDFDLDHLNPSSVEAFEVYHGISQTPIEYSHHCGVILVWLRY